MEVWAGLVPSEGFEEKSGPSFFPSFWWFGGNLWHQPICFHLYMALSLCICLHKVSAYKDSSYIGIGAHLTPM